MSVDRATLLGPALLALEQRFGFLGIEFAGYAPVLTSETTTSTTYANLTTTGPSLSNLPDGQYAVLFGASVSNNTAGVGSRMSVSVNGAAASDNDASITGGLAGHATQDMRLFTAILDDAAAGGVNSLVAKYRVGSASTGTFQQRWLAAFRIANV